MRLFRNISVFWVLITSRHHPCKKVTVDTTRSAYLETCTFCKADATGFSAPIQLRLILFNSLCIETYSDLSRSPVPSHAVLWPAIPFVSSYGISQYSLEIGGIYRNLKSLSTEAMHSISRPLETLSTFRDLVGPLGAIQSDLGPILSHNFLQSPATLCNPPRPSAGSHSIREENRLHDMRPLTTSHDFVRLLILSHNLLRFLRSSTAFDRKNLRHLATS